MRNPEIVHLFKAIAISQRAKEEGTKIIYEQTAIELEKLEKIYTWAENNKHCPFVIHDILYRG